MQASTEFCFHVSSTKSVNKLPDIYNAERSVERCSRNLQSSRFLFPRRGVDPEPYGRLKTGLPKGSLV